MTARNEHIYENGIEKKWCNPCGCHRPIKSFPKDRRRWDGRGTVCRDCKNASSRRYYEKNRAKCYEVSKQWRLSNVERFRELQRRSYKKLSKSPKRRVDNAMSCRVRSSLRNKLSGKQTKNGSGWSDLVGYTLNDLVKHLEGLFDDDMNWDNYGSAWEIDHILPISSFSYNNPQNKDFKRCWSLNNLQPLSVFENRSKSNKLCGETTPRTQGELQ